MADKRAMKRALLSFVVLLMACPPPAFAERAVTVFAAASLGGALDEIAQSFSTPTKLAYGGSGAMARQIAAGAPADLVVLANPVWMEWLADQGAIERDASMLVAGNALVLIAPSGAQRLEDVSLLPDQLANARLAMGQRDAVPAGVYARQWLQNAVLWQALSTRLAETDNVRAALALVARGDAPFGVVYASDAHLEPRVEVHYRIPQDAHDPILYPAAALTPEGAAFLEHLTTPAAGDIFAAYGFQKVTP
jgi:molybdate transport system substrate-binding protein